MLIPVHQFRLYRSAKICKKVQFAAKSAAVLSLMHTTRAVPAKACQPNVRHANTNAGVVNFLKRNGDFHLEEHMFMLALVNLILYPVNSWLEIANLSSESNFATL